MTEAVWVVLQKELKQDQEAEQEETDCAWCLDEAGEEMGEGSHGICPRHADEQYQQYRTNRGQVA